MLNEIYKTCFNCDAYKDCETIENVKVCIMRCVCLNIASYFMLSKCAFHFEYVIENTEYKMDVLL